MYPKIIQEHFTYPKNVGRMKNPTATGSFSMPDLAKAVFYFLIEEGIVKDIKYQIAGCPFAIAVCSILSEYAKGKNVKELKNITLDTLGLFFEIPTEKEECINLSLNAFLDGVKSA
jgi:nitrogen fixation NifU-like protein